jgi:hypothetical protein
VTSCPPLSSRIDAAEKNAAINVRVSTNEKETDMQEVELRECVVY